MNDLQFIGILGGILVIIAVSMILAASYITMWISIQRTEDNVAEIVRYLNSNKPVITDAESSERSQMTTKELRDLDAWIAEHVMQWDAQIVDARLYLWRPTTDPATAMNIIKKCAEKICHDWDERNCIQIQFWDLEWHIADSREDSDLPPATAKTLELAICLFAKQLFNQTTK